jgi:hypothetical protein
MTKPSYTIRGLFLTLSLCLLSQIFVGCGYSMKSSLDPKFQSIYVEPFKNNSREYDLQAPLVNALTRKFMNDGRLRVVQKDMADLIVTGSITEYELKGQVTDVNDEVTQFEMRMWTKVRVFDPKTGEELWSDDVSSVTYYSTLRGDTPSHRLRGNTQVEMQVVRSFQTDRENRAAAEALEIVASDIFYRTIEPW